MNEHNIPFDESLISAYLDGELSDQEKHEVESAIRSTPALQKLTRDLSAVRSMVASTALKSDKLTRSIQSPEWSVPNTNNSDLPAEVLSKTPSSQLVNESNRPRISLGLLASLAAIVLILITTKLLIDAQPDSNMQVVMDGNAPGSSAPAPLQMKPARPDENRDTADEAEVLADSTVARKDMSSNAEVAMAPMSAVPMIDPQMVDAAVPELSTEAKEFLAYLEQKLNSEPNTLETSRWRFTTEIETAENAIVSSTMRGRDNSGSESIKDVVVELGQSKDEIVLQVTEDEAKSIFKLANNDPDLPEVFASDQELLAFATLRSIEEKQTDNVKIENDHSELVPEGVREQTWSIAFSPPPTDTVAFAPGVNRGAGMELPNAAGMGTAGSSRAGGGYGSNPNEDSQGSLSKAPGATYLSPKARTMRSADRSERQSTSSPIAPQPSLEQSTQTLQSVESSKMTADPGSISGAYGETPSKEKLKRIRIKIKKEPSSSGSNE